MNKWPNEDPVRFKLNAEARALERENEIALAELKQLPPSPLRQELAELCGARSTLKKSLWYKRAYRAYELAPISKKERKEKLALLEAGWLADGVDPEAVKSGIRALKTGDDRHLLNQLELTEVLIQVKRAQITEPATHEQRLHLIELIKARAERLAKRPRLVRGP